MTNAATTIVRGLTAAMLFIAGLWGSIEGVSHAVAHFGPVPVALVAAVVVTAIVTFAVTRWLMPPPPPQLLPRVRHAATQMRNRVPLHLRRPVGA